MIDLLYLFVLLVFVIAGLRSPQIALMGYIWVDIIGPQRISYGFLYGKPLSMVIAAILVLSIALNCRSVSLPKSALLPLALLTFAAWITYTSSNAMFPDVAWAKWDWAFKAVVFTLLMACIIGSKLDCELLILTIVFSFSFYTLATGIKTLFNGGGYGVKFIFSSVDSGLKESSTMSAIAVICISLKLFLLQHSSILPRRNKFVVATVIFLIFTDILTVIGTQARTGLVLLCCLTFIEFLRSRRKVVYLGCCSLVALTVLLVAPASWYARMNTIEAYASDSSAAGRIAVWQWTLDFVDAHPMGGGFGAYNANKGELAFDSSEHGTVTNASAKAFHSIIFEVLGEHGYPGAILFMSIVSIALLKLYRIHRVKKETEKGWMYDISATLMICISLYLVAGLFIGIAFQPVIYYFIALALVTEKLVAGEKAMLSTEADPCAV